MRDGIAESKRLVGFSILDSGFWILRWILDSGFRILDSEVGFWIPDSGFWIQVGFWILDSGFSFWFKEECCYVSKMSEKNISDDVLCLSE